MTQNELDRKYDELFESEEFENDPDSVQRKWNQFIKDSGCIEGHHVECNWGEFGVFPFIDALIRYVNDDKQVVVLEDPSSENSDYMGYLVFPR